MTDDLIRELQTAANQADGLGDRESGDIMRRAAVVIRRLRALADAQQQVLEHDREVIGTLEKLAQLDRAPGC